MDLLSARGADSLCPVIAMTGLRLVFDTSDVSSLMNTSIDTRVIGFRV